MDTPLYQACCNGKVETVRTLLQEDNSNVNDTGRCGFAPIHQATSKGYLEIVKLLLKHGADANCDGGGYFKMGALACALSSFQSMPDYPEIAQLLVEHGAYIHAAVDDLKATWTVFDLAIWGGYYEVVKAMVGQEIGINTNFVYFDSGDVIDLEMTDCPKIKELLKKYNLRIEKYNLLHQLEEWRPWNHSKYPLLYRNIAKTLVILAKVRQ